MDEYVYMDTANYRGEELLTLSRVEMPEPSFDCQRHPSDKLGSRGVRRAETDGRDRVTIVERIFFGIHFGK